ncbi:hypothetical protein PINS_up008625 [Pythium insidiosum]|nr:hypothetical protein PINS_up008625 [Pythium insidiosum]
MAQAKGRNKNKAEKENLEALITRHKWHILKLEQINRLLDNDALEPSQVDDLKEDVDYYLEANQVRWRRRRCRALDERRLPAHGRTGCGFP